MIAELKGKLAARAARRSGEVRYHLSPRGRGVLARACLRSLALLAAYGALLFLVAFVVLPNTSLSGGFYEALFRLTASEQEVDESVVGPEQQRQIERARYEVESDIIRNYLAECVSGGSEPRSDGMRALVDEVRAVLQEQEVATGTESDAEGDTDADAVDEPDPFADDIAVNDAIWVVAGDLSDNEDLVDELYPEARDAMGADFSEVQLYGWTSAEDPDVQYTAYGDGRVVRQDFRLYQFAMASVQALAIVLAAGGAAAVLLLSLRGPVAHYDALYQMASGLLDADAEPPEVPRAYAEDRALLLELRDRQRERERAATAAETRKNELVAYLAHDIKTPLTSVTGYLALLDEAPDMPAEQRGRYTSAALAKAYRLDAMLDEFFDITRFNIGELEAERAHMDLATFCEQVADEFGGQAAARGVSIEVEASEGCSVSADPEKLARAVDNIMRNALAYAEQGTAVHLAAYVEDTQRSSDAKGGGAPRDLVIAISNQGREIAPGHLERIFEKFYREDGARPSGQGGAGLGLAIAREIARAHGGDITAESAAGVTTFTLRIPQ